MTTQNYIFFVMSLLMLTVFTASVMRDTREGRRVPLLDVFMVCVSGILLMASLFLP